jgi:hypothetical protein
MQISTPFSRIEMYSYEYPKRAKNKIAVKDSFHCHFNITVVGSSSPSHWLQSPGLLSGFAEVFRPSPFILTGRLIQREALLFLTRMRLSNHSTRIYLRSIIKKDMWKRGMGLTEKY